MTVTYTSLVADTPDILAAQNRTLLTVMPKIIRRAEDEVFQKLDRDAFRVALAGPYTVSPSVPAFDVTPEPQRVLELRAVRASTSGFTVTLERRNIQYLHALFGDAQGTPRFYAEGDAPQVFRVFPTPDTAYTLAVTANVEPLRLSVSQDTTLLTQQFPRLIEMAVLKHAAHYMRNRVDEDRYTSEFTAALESENLRLERRRRDETGTTGKQTASLTG